MKPITLLIATLLSAACFTASAQQTIKTYVDNENPDSRYDINRANGTVHDIATGLIWKRCSEVQTGDDCTGNRNTYTWQEALAAAEQSTYAGFTDWRLPNIHELRSIVAYDRTNPAINIYVFPNTGLFGYWSSSPTFRTRPSARSIDFFFGADQAEEDHANPLYVRLVRGGR